jgi:hypothetical protein
MYIFPLLCLLLTFVYLLWPFKSFLYDLRVYFIKLLIKFFFPFGRNRICFKLLIFATIMSTLSRAFVSFTHALCVLSCYECRLTNQILQCDTNYIISYSVQVFPSIFRAIIFLNSFYFTKLWFPHFVGAMRFVVTAISLTISLLNSLEYLNMYYVVAVNSLATVYNIYWDYFVSWKVFQAGSKNLFLRNNLAYKKWFYYFAIFTNLVIRASWTLRYVPNLESDKSLFIQSILEVARRFQWYTIRVENEYFNNPEKFRKFIPVPELTEDIVRIEKLT